MSLSFEYDIDLSRRQVAGHPCDPAVTGAVLAGRGRGALHLLEEVGPEVDPLGPDNLLFIGLGLLTGTVAPSSARIHLTARSPLTGYLGSSSIGGKVGPALRSAGVGGLCLRGRAEDPVYLLVEDGGVTLQAAGDLWGLDVRQAAEKLGNRHGPAAVMLLIGPAGENQVPLACITTQRGHAAGRTGLGAVMGAKKVKAVVVLEGARSDPAGPGARAAVKAYLHKIRTSPRYAEFAEFGTTAAVGWANRQGMLATRNFAQPQYLAAAALDGPNLDRYVERRRGCPRCPVHCKAEVRLTAGRFAGLAGERPDFEPLVAWGSKCMLGDPEAVFHLHNLCDRLGLDSVSAGSAVAFAMHLFERGILTERDTGGRALHWGDVDAMEKLVWDMAFARGFGAILAGGVRGAAGVIGRGAERYAYHVKGLELTAYDPRGAYGAALGYAVSNRGADFTSVYARHEFDITPEDAFRLYGTVEAGDPLSPAGKAAMVRRGMLVCAVLDSIGICKIPALSLINEYDLDEEAALVSALGGVELSAADLFGAGERILNLERLFNLRCGATVKEDGLPEVFHREPLASGPAAGYTVDVAGMRSEFYALMGWSPQGVPTAAKLSELGLERFGPAAGPAAASAQWRDIP